MDIILFRGLEFVENLMKMLLLGTRGSGSGEKRRVDDGLSMVAAADTGTQRRRSHRLIDNSTSTVRHDVEASTTFSDAARKNKKQKQKCSVTRYRY